tara:strand:- start:1372 stop:2166 length:795 start_codon:yes stop_codon:yes gene_type:complete
MHKDTPYLRSIMLQHEDISDRLAQLKNSYEGETCYIVSSGPSLKNFEEDYLRNKLKDELVISVKQSINLLKGIADFHVLNFTNFQPYDYTDSEDTIVTWEVFEQYHPQMILDNNFKCELMLPVVGNHESDLVKRINESQAGTESFDDWTLDKTMNRMYGPGIMYEVVIHLALYLGVKEIRTIGWDIGDVSKFKQDDLYEDVWQDHSYDGSDNIKYAKTPMNYHEVNTVVKSVKYLSEWLKTKGVDFKIISDRNPAHKSIERIQL